MILEYLYQTHGNGYIAGEKDGIVTVGGVPASRQICVLDIKTLAWVQRTTSNNNGNYLIMGLDPNKKYLIMARDLPPTDGVERYEPAVGDYVTPKDDKTIDEQMELWQSSYSLSGRSVTAKLSSDYTANKQGGLNQAVISA